MHATIITSRKFCLVPFCFGLTYAKFRDAKEQSVAPHLTYLELIDFFREVEAEKNDHKNVKVRRRD